jgi:hypothetical protein
MDIHSFFTKPKGTPSVSGGGYAVHEADPIEKGMHPLPIGKPGCLNNLKFCISGVQRSLEIPEVEELIKKYGGQVTSAVSNRTSYLVFGEDGGPLKRKAAANYGTKIIDEKGLFDMISASISVSDRVCVGGLVQAANHNGKFGVITAIKKDTGRIRVKLDGGNMEIDVKPHNILNCEDVDEDVLDVVLTHELPINGKVWEKMMKHVFQTICNEKQSSQQHSNDPETYKLTEQEAIELLDLALKNIPDISCARVDEVLRNCGHFEIPNNDDDDVDDTKLVFSDKTKTKEWVVANCKITEIYSETQIVQEYKKIQNRKKEQLRINTEIQNREKEIAALKTELAQL